MASSIASEIASTIQAGHIEHHPDPIHDNAPATSVDRREPVSLHPVSKHLDDDEDAISIDDDDNDIPYSVLRPAPRSQGLPPLPDLRFEQSYLHSIEKADTVGKVLLITLRDQVRIRWKEAQRGGAGADIAG